MVAWDLCGLLRKHTEESDPSGSELSDITMDPGGKVKPLIQVV